MEIKQYNDEALAHYSYAILSGKEIALVDPARNPQPYYEFAEENDAKIVAVFESHPHADFISSHYQVHKETGAKIYVSEKLGAEYPHKTFDEGDTLTLGDVQFSAINTPGHSPDSICILAKDNTTHEEALFTGDTLFIGDMGRPDLREDVGNFKATREALAKDMYYTVQNKFTDLSDDVIIYPAHGAGSLCGKNMSDAESSTLGAERLSNWAFQEQTEEKFVERLLSDQPFVPSYFGYDVDTNKNGPDDYMSSIWSVPLKLNVSSIEDDHLIIDTRNHSDRTSHLPNSVNIMARGEDDSFETWLGAIVKPDEKYTLVLQSVKDYQYILDRISRIGYEKQIASVVTLAKDLDEKTEKLDLNSFKSNPDDFTIVDIRNHSELAEGLVFDNALHYPLNNLRKTANDIPEDKPIVVHCAADYRSRAGFGLIKNIKENAQVYDLGMAVSDFKSPEEVK